MGLFVTRPVPADFSTPAAPPLEMTKDLSFRPSEPLVISTERQRAEKSKARSFQKEKASRIPGGRNQIAIV